MLTQWTLQSVSVNKLLDASSFCILYLWMIEFIYNLKWVFIKGSNWWQIVINYVERLYFTLKIMLDRQIISGKQNLWL